MSVDAGEWLDMESIASPDGLVLLCTAVAAGLGAWLLARNLLRAGSGLKLPPGPLGLPWLGDSLAFLRDPLGLMQRRHDQYGPIYRCIHVGSTAAIKKVFSSESTLVQASLPLSMNLMFGKGAMSAAHGEDHQRLRKLMTPALAPGAVAGYLPRVVDIFEEFIAQWIKAGNIHGRNQINAATFKVAVEVILGFDKTWTAPGRIEKLQVAWSNLLKAFFAPPIPLTQYIPGTGLYKGMQARRIVRKAANEALNQAQRQLDAGADLLPHSANLGAALLTATDGAGKPLGREQIKDLCLGVLFAGHETTAQAILLLLLTLKQNPRVLERVVEEQRQVAAKHGDGITEGAFRDMVYAEACAREILRVQPVAGLVVREAITDFTLEGYNIHKGDSLWLGIRRATKHLDERWNSNEQFPAAEFMPERWLSEEGRSGGGSWMPFGAGARLCIGINLALAEIKVALALLTRRCEWEVNPEEKIAQFPIVTPANGLPMTVAPKSSAFI